MGTRPHFRARPINYTRPLPIVRSNEDPYYDDDANNQRDVPQVPTGMEAHETEEIHLKNALKNAVFGDKKQDQIPLPIYSKVPKYKEKRFTKWERPQQYIIFDRTDEDLMEHTTDYSLDAIDDKWYNSLSDRKRGTLTPATLEIAMDTLERIQGRAEELITSSQAKPHLEQLIPNDTTKLTVYNHWASRRREFGEPFHRLFKSPVDPQEPSHAIAFRPRSDSAGTARRQNTYENYKRLAALAPQFQALRELLASINKRETLKASEVAIKMFRTRIECAQQSPRTVSAFKALCTGSYEVALVAAQIQERPASSPVPSNPAIVPSKQSPPLHIPLRGLDLPDEVHIGLKKLTPPRRRRSKAANKGTKAAVSEQSRQTRDKRINEEPAGFGALTGTVTDQYGYDEMASKFMRHMRYFAGNFANFGVNPYDHRVFSAASERNTVTEDPKEPRPVVFPTEIPFAKEVSVAPGQTGGKYSMKPQQSNQSPGRSIKVRARVGRLGRLILDRVIYEPEHGVKAASYPASIAMGGVYTAGLPLEYSEDVLGTEYGEESWDEDEKKLILPLEPIIPLKRPVSQEDSLEQIAWPSLRKLRSGRIIGQAHGKLQMATEQTEKDEKNGITRHPRYILRPPSLIEEV
eukprot:Plantae.Rhodophyta-Hildenbrandia_rubra.ctg24878.p1 GENE.Plantae.Rhodophyta-Hildenbrandia_rubra.ctg24878~~Plantae.Rhodophyta-Hildenbrandia_rubra.ctg24878.p1  ORF type:complete len:633 (-),score=94.94 Plantae.Rhodophyta-Hildenbrandia_rubra.ctg24878:1762-3660(-)